MRGALQSCRDGRRWHGLRPPRRQRPRGAERHRRGQQSPRRGSATAGRPAVGYSQRQVAKGGTVAEAFHWSCKEVVSFDHGVGGRGGGACLPLSLLAAAGQLCSLRPRAQGPCPSDSHPRVLGPAWASAPSRGHPLSPPRLALSRFGDRVVGSQRGAQGCLRAASAPGVRHRKCPRCLSGGGCVCGSAGSPRPPRLALPALARTPPLACVWGTAELACSTPTPQTRPGSHRLGRTPSGHRPHAGRVSGWREGPPAAAGDAAGTAAWEGVRKAGVQGWADPAPARSHQPCPPSPERGRSRAALWQAGPPRAAEW